MKEFTVCAAVTLMAVAAIGGPAMAGQHFQKGQASDRAKNIIFFLGDGMGVSTVTASRIHSVDVDGVLTMDRFPLTVLSETDTADHITPDSSGSMTAMMTGVNTNQGLIGMGPEKERNDFRHDGDGEPLVSFLEIAKGMGKKVGVVTTARVTHATPAACYAHVNDRDKESEIALQALPSDSTYNTRLGDGLDLLMGGGRQFPTPSGTADEEGGSGSCPGAITTTGLFTPWGFRTNKRIRNRFYPFPSKALRTRSWTQPSILAGL